MPDNNIMILGMYIKNLIRVKSYLYKEFLHVKMNRKNWNPHKKFNNLLVLK